VSNLGRRFDRRGDLHSPNRDGRSSC
jgi:hypothetical protein